RLIFFAGSVAPQPGHASADVSTLWPHARQGMSDMVLLFWNQGSGIRDQESDQSAAASPPEKYR
ncbi:MAG: hypothetical protein LBM17_08340, partial [Candidatus Accumulibacter sp.]|nr:hypothetical protein [Accumulibacter sp.]